MTDECRKIAEEQPIGVCDPQCGWKHDALVLDYGTRCAREGMRRALLQLLDLNIDSGLRQIIVNRRAALEEEKG
jgi:hypothetical protein